MELNSSKGIDQVINAWHDPPRKMTACPGVMSNIDRG